MVSTGAIKAGRAFVELGINDKMTAALRKASAKLKAFGNSVSAIGSKLAGFGAAVGAPLVAAGKVFADFERSMSMVSTMLDEPEKHMEGFSEGIRKLSKDFGESTDVLAKGLYDILSAGIAPSEALKVLEASAKAATGGMTDTATAVDAVTTMLNSYGLEASHAGDVSDLLFAIVKRGKTTFGEVAGSIGQVASVARSTGVSMEELGAMLATMTRNGLSTSESVTAIRSALSAFLKPTKEAADAFRELTGMEMNPAAIKSLGGMRGVMELIRDMPPDAVAKIFPNVRALSGMLPALNDLQNFDADLATMAGRTGLAEDAFNKMKDTMTQAFKSMKQAGLDLLVTVGSALVPVFQDLTETFHRVTAIVAPWLEQNKELVAIIAKVAIGAIAGGLALMVLGKAFALVGTAVGVAATILGVLKAVLLAILSPIGLTIAAIAGIGYALYKFTDIGKEVVGKAMDIFGGIADVAGIAFDGVKDALAAGDWGLAAKIGWSGIKAAWTSGVNVLREAWIGFKSVFMNSMTDIATGTKKAWTSVQTWFKKGWNNLKALFGSADSEAMAAANRKLETEAERRRKQIEAEGEATKSARNEKYAAEMRAIGEEERAAKQELERLRNEAKRKREEREAKLKGIKDGLDSEGGFDPDAFMSDLSADMAGIKPLAKRGEMSSTGFTSSFAALRMAGNAPSDIDKQTEENTKKTAEIVKKMKQVLEDGIDVNISDLTFA
jgi:TP901 family phage tail tape measure protein